MTTTLELTGAMLIGSADVHGAALGAGFVASVTTGAGQLCTSPGLVFAVGDASEFLAAVAGAVSAAPGAAMLTAGIRQSYADGVARLAVGATDGAIAECGRVGLYVTDGETFLADPTLQEEIFGATSLVVRVRDLAELDRILDSLEGQLTATVHAATADHPAAAALLPRLELLAGRVLFGWPTGVEVGHAVVHDGPFPATSAPSTTSVGTRAIERFLRPVSYQNVPDALLPEELRDGNPLAVPRLRDGSPE
ncbi:MAG: hypothetical protein GEV28_34330 [Actinophytocola sp.]|uniref:hypothetical protein n=1 Tax=Actinophytocola sp. TaxID=1872138 RepID=UPI001321036E|nr:hypothetical protein [Actinophytocola sp.]MPZ85193.1 hypothetical protein [Actinophytocola sp.]